MTHGQRVKRLRDVLGLSTAQIAEIFGVSAPSMNNWISGRTAMRHEFQCTLLRLEADNIASLSPSLSHETLQAFRQGRLQVGSPAWRRTA